MDRLTPDQAQIVEQNLGLVGFTIGRYYRHRFDHDDLFQDGVFGLARAAQLYDPEIAAFSTYAVLWIRQAIGRGLEMRLGSGYRTLTRKGLEWEAPLSLDSLGEHGKSGLDEFADPAALVEAEVVARDYRETCGAALAAASNDAVDRDIAGSLLAAADVGAKPETLEAIGRRNGVSRETVRKRRKRLTIVARDRLSEYVA